MKMFDLDGANYKVLRSEILVVLSDAHRVVPVVLMFALALHFTAVVCDEAVSIGVGTQMHRGAVLIFIAAIMMWVVMEFKMYRVALECQFIERKLKKGAIATQRVLPGHEEFLTTRGLRWRLGLLEVVSMIPVTWIIVGSAKALYDRGDLPFVWGVVTLLGLGITALVVTRKKRT